MLSHFNWRKCCPRNDSMNVSLARSMINIRNFFILWNFDAAICGSVRFSGNQMAWIFEVT
jgi:hypothetical protein